jgi:hypothetical protein
MGGFFGCVAQDDCLNDLFFGTDYHSQDPFITLKTTILDLNLKPIFLNCKAIRVSVLSVIMTLNH